MNQYLLAFICGLLLVWYVWVQWKNRQYYKFAMQLPGPRCLPIIRNLHHFIFPDGGFHQILGFLKHYPRLLRLWVGPWLIIVTDRPDVAKILLSSPKAVDKPFVYFVLDMSIKNGLVTSRAGKWRRHRKAISPSFNQRILDTFVEIFSRKSSILADSLKSLCGSKTLDIYNEACKCTCDIICESALGVDMNIQKSNWPIGHHFETITSMLNCRVFCWTYHFDIIWNLTPSSRKLNTSLNYIHERFDEVINKKLESFRNVPDETTLMSKDDQPIKRKAILEFLNEHSSFTQEEMIEEFYTFLSAGTETTAATFCFICIMLGMFPDIQQKVYEEVVSVVGHDEVILPDHLKKLEYTERVINETMRLFPLAPIIGRELTFDIPLEDGLTIPNGSIVAITIANIHRNPLYWPDPLKFDPDRFLPEQIKKRHPCSFIPFSYGPRNCIGAHYAMMNLKTMLGMLIPQFNMHTDYKSVDEIKLTTNLFLRAEDGFKIWVEPRCT